MFWSFTSVHNSCEHVPSQGEKSTNDSSACTIKDNVKEVNNWLGWQSSAQAQLLNDVAVCNQCYGVLHKLASSCLIDTFYQGTWHKDVTMYSESWQQNRMAVLPLLKLNTWTFTFYSALKTRGLVCIHNHNLARWQSGTGHCQTRLCTKGPIPTASLWHEAVGGCLY